MRGDDKHVSPRTVQAGLRGPRSRATDIHGQHPKTLRLPPRHFGSRLVHRFFDDGVRAGHPRRDAGFHNRLDGRLGLWRLRTSFSERLRQVAGADEQRTDARHAQNLVENYGRNDPDGARKWIAELNLPADKKVELLNQIKK